MSVFFCAGGRSTTCLGQLSHRKHSSVRRHCFLSSCAKPLPTSLPAVAFSFLTSSDVCGHLALNDFWFYISKMEDSVLLNARGEFKVSTDMCLSIFIMHK